ncbi:MAG TPA: glycosyltransferase family 4 protein [Elusimicrobiota bacterium]|nr:glycosyltransferase family 4 protein [Elusimicrobiota bacterium]
MNICLLTKTTSAHGWGGVEVHVQMLRRRVPESGHSLTVIASRLPDGAPMERTPHGDVHYLPETTPGRYNRAFWTAVERKFRELHAAKKFDVVWGEDFAGYSYAFATRRHRPAPLLSFLHGPTFRGRLESERRRLDSFVEWARFAAVYVPESFLFYRPWYAETLAHSDKLLAVSPQAAERYRREYGVPGDKISVLPDGVDTLLFKPEAGRRARCRKRYELADGTPVLLMAAVVHKQKGMHVGLKAFGALKKDVPGAKLLVAGDGPHLSELRSLSERMGLKDDVVFCGRVPNDEMPDLYNAADIFLNPTLRWEGLTITTLEALACGKPCIVSRCGGTESTLEDKVSGFFVPPNDPVSIAVHGVELLRDRTLYDRMSRNARQRADTHFNEEKIVQELLSLSRQLAERGSPA